MIEIILKIGLSIIGGCFICFLWTNSNDLYGTKKSIQLWTLTILLVILIVYLILDIFPSSDLEFFVSDLSELPRSTVETYFSLLVTILIGFVGVIAVVLSVLYGAHMKKTTHADERKKLSKQNRIWFCFSMYFIVIMVVLFIWPLMKQLGSI